MRPTQSEKPKAAKREPDDFQRGRALYNARRRCLEKADKLFEDADSRARALCSKLEEEDASQPIGLVPSSLNIETE